MGNAGGSLKKHIETAQKTGALNFTDKGLEKFPPELGQVAGSLRNLDLSNNKLTALPQTLGSYKILKSLNVSRNRIVEIPQQIENLIKLEILNLSFNCIQKIPHGFSKLKNLKEIDLSHNNLTEFPTSLVGLKHLNVINLTKNKITLIPEEVRGIEATEINLNENQISGISVAIAECPRLRTLRLEENCLSLDVIPTPLLSDSGVSLLSLDGNLFDTKSLDSLPGYDKYMERYTAVKRKLD
eukprot:TRINITY_DN18259_c0_g2_i1.p1 TRINITY_DN18259_c0_g2~~TRINITY_DN18259_c0_g2_i1.p1  ORF type:complete len:241 (+),score=51.51 TRINITY_DN18259_c0_g2_i1:41-763(+)